MEMLQDGDRTVSGRRKISMRYGGGAVVSVRVEAPHGGVAQEEGYHVMERRWLGQPDRRLDDDAREAGELMVRELVLLTRYGEMAG